MRAPLLALLLAGLTPDERRRRLRARAAFVVALTVVAGLAGCLQPASAPTTSTPVSSTPTSSTPQGIAVGEPDPSGGGPRPTGGMAVRPAEGTNESANFTLAGNESFSLILAGGAVTFSFLATNDGENATVLYDPCGAGNPTIEILDPNGTALTLDEPGMHCMVAVSWQPMAAGAQIARNLTWDGRAWNGQERAAVPPGHYTAHATFYAQRDGADVTITLDLPVGVTDKPGEL